MKPGSYKINEFFARAELGKKNTCKSGSCCYRILLLNASDLHAHVLGFNYYSHSDRIQTFLYAVPDLGRQPFLNLKPPAEGFDNPCDLAETCYISVRNVRNMRFAVKREHMMFTQGVKVDIFHQDHLLVFFPELC